MNEEKETGGHEDVRIPYALMIKRKECVKKAKNM